MARRLTPYASLRRALRESRGVVMIEFLIAFLPILLLFLGTLQLSLLYVADLFVRHAAITAVRAAIVVLPDDPSFYGGEKTGQISESGGQASTASDELGALAGAFGGVPAQSSGKLTALGNSPGPRLSAIRRAAGLPLSAIAPEVNTVLRLFTDGEKALSVSDVLGTSPLTRLASALLEYNPAAMAVTFPESPGSNKLRTDHVPCTGDVTLRVTYLYHCGIPLASALLCDSALSAAFKLMLQHVLGKPKDGSSDYKQGLEEIDHAPASSARALLLATRARFRMLRAEASMPNQSASYSCTDN